MPSDANGRSDIAMFHTIPHSQSLAMGHVLPESNLALFRNCMRMQILNALHITMYAVVAFVASVAISRQDPIAGPPMDAGVHTPPSAGRSVVGVRHQRQKDDEEGCRANPCATVQSRLPCGARRFWLRQCQK